MGHQNAPHDCKPIEYGAKAQYSTLMTMKSLPLPQKLTKPFEDK